MGCASSPPLGVSTPACGKESTGMDIPADDHEFLRREGYEYTVVEDQGKLCVLLLEVKLPAGLSAPTADVLLRLEPLYPDVPPDMWWIAPALTTSQGRIIPATEVSEIYLGRTWQRWSRHLGPGAWMAGTDSLESYLILFRN